MTELEGCIRYWKDKLKSMRAYLSPDEVVLIESTIRKLQELQRIQEGG